MATVTIKCVDAVTKQLISGAFFNLLYKESRAKGYINVELIENAEGIFQIEGLVQGNYNLEEIESPFYTVQVEDEFCDFYNKRQTYQLLGKTFFAIEDDNDIEVVLEHIPAEATYEVEKAGKTSFEKKRYLFKKWLSLYDRSHELNNREFRNLAFQLGGGYVVGFILFLWLFHSILGSSLHLGLASNAVIFFGALMLAVFAWFLELKKFSTPQNRVLDKIPEPIRTGPNMGIYGSSEIVRDPKLVKKVLSSTCKLNDIEIDDPGVYCGYYQCPTEQRLWNIFAEFMNRKGKHDFKKFSGYYVYIPDDLHAIIYGDTRAGKTRRVLLSTIHLISRGKKESFIIFDAKREILALTSERLKNEGYDIKVYDFEHPENSTRHNPLYVAIDLIKQNKMTEASQEVEERVKAMFTPEELTGETGYFYTGAKNLIKVVTLAVLCDNECPEDQKTFTTVSRMLEDQVTKRPVDASKPQGAKFSPFEEYIEGKFALDSIVLSAYGVLRQTEERHMVNFISTAQGKLAIFRDPSIEDMTRVTENPCKNIAEYKQAVFIVAPAHKEAFQGLATMFLDQMYSELRGEASEDSIVNGVHQVGRTSRRVNFICEEILSINPWDKLKEALNIGAGLGLRFFLIIQNQQLFNERYGREQAKGIRPNCATQMLITTGDPEETAAHWKRMIGTMTVESVSKVVSGSRLSPIKTNTSITRSPCKRDCLDDAEIQGWNANCGLLVKTTLLENVINIPLPDVSCTPTEDFFQLGTKQDNLEKASKILRQSFKDPKQPEYTKTHWLPGIPDVANKQYTDDEIRKFLKDQTERYIKAYFSRVKKSPEQKKDEYKVAVAYNKKMHEIFPYSNLKDLHNDLMHMKYAAKDGWETKKFKSTMDMQEFIGNFNRTGKKQSHEGDTLYN